MIPHSASPVLYESFEITDASGQKDLSFLQVDPDLKILPGSLRHSGIPRGLTGSPHVIDLVLNSEHHPLALSKLSFLPRKSRSLGFILSF